MTSFCAIAVQLIETHQKAYAVCAMTLLVELGILDESGSNMMKNDCFVWNTSKTDRNT